MEFRNFDTITNNEHCNEHHPDGLYQSSCWQRKLKITKLYMPVIVIKHVLKMFEASFSCTALQMVLLMVQM